MTSLPSLGHLGNRRRINVPQPIERAHFVSRGNHILLGQRRNAGRSDALILLGKCIEQTRVSNKYDSNVWLDVSTPHVIYICGRRGTGKSYDLGILAEGLLLTSDSRVSTKEKKITTVIFDTQSQFWALSAPPDESLAEDKDQLDHLRNWGLPARGIEDTRLFIPAGESSNLPDVEEFSIEPSDLDVDDWCGLFGLERYSPQGQVFHTLIQKVGVDGYDVEGGGRGSSSIRRVDPTPQYDLSDLIRCLREDIELGEQSQRQTRDAVLWKIESLRDSALFRLGGINVTEILKPGQLSVFLLRSLDNSTKALVVSVFAKKIFEMMGDYHTTRKIATRLGQHLPERFSGLPEGVWVLIDEAQLICPSDSHTAAKEPLIEYVKRGRDAGLSLVLATQQPSAVDSRVVSQVDLLITHRLAVDADISAALSRAPAEFPGNVSFGTAKVTDRHALIRALETGEAWIADAEASRAFLAIMRPRVSAHGGDEPLLV